MQPKVVSLSKCSDYSFSKQQVESIDLIEGIGVEGDVHAGEKVKHRSRVRRDPNQPNLRQVHLIHSELFDELRERGFEVKPGDIGENITTQGIALLDLPTGAILEIGDAVIEVTGLRNPCNQLNNFHDGLQQAVLKKDADGNLIRKSGIMGVVLRGGKIRTGDKIMAKLPEKPHFRLQPV